MNLFKAVGTVLKWLVYGKAAHVGWPASGTVVG